MPCLTTWAPFFLCGGFANVDNVITKRCSKQSHGCSFQGCKARNHTGTLQNLPNPASGTYTPARTGTLRNPPEPSGTCLRNLHKHAPELSNLLESSGTHTGTHWNLPAEPTPEPSGNYLQHLHQHTPQPGIFRNLPPEPTPAPAGTLRNLPEPASGTYTVTRRNSPKPSGINLRNLHRHTLELSGTFRNQPPEPTPAHTGTLRNLPESTSGTYTGARWNSPEPSSGTFLRNLHRHTPEPSGTFLRNLLLRPAPAHTEAIWAEDPISLRCWGKTAESSRLDQISDWSQESAGGAGKACPRGGPSLGEFGA